MRTLAIAVAALLVVLAVTVPAPGAAPTSTKASPTAKVPAATTSTAPAATKTAPAVASKTSASASAATGEGPDMMPFLRDIGGPSDPLEAAGSDPDGQALRHYMRGRIRLFDQDTPGAFREFRQAAALAPKVHRVWLSLGLTLYDQGNQNACVQALDEALRLDPTDATTLYFRGRLAAGAGDMKRASELFTTLLATARRGSPYFILATHHMASILKDNGDLKGAIEHYKTLLAMLEERQGFFQRYPEIVILFRSQVQLRQKLAELQVQAGDDDGAIVTLREVLAERPESVDLLSLMFTATLQKKDYERAKEWARKIIEVSPDGATGYQRLAEAYKAEGKPEGALTELEKFLAERPKNRLLAFQVAALYESMGRKDEAARIYSGLSTVPDKTPGMGAAAAIKLADLKLAEGKPVEAIEALGAGIVGDTAEPAILIRAARIIDGLKEPEKAYEEAQRLVTDDQKGYGMFLLVGIMAERAKRLPDAVALYDKALVRQPKAALAYSRKADLLIDTGHHEEALAVYQAALKAGLDLPVFHRQSGLILEHLDRMDEAIAEYRIARQAAPDDETSRYLLAGALARKGEYDEAEKELKGLIARFPNKVQPYCQLAAVYLAKGDLEAAEKTAKQAQDLDAASLNPKAILAEVRFRQKKYDEAEALAREILKEQPDDREVRVLLVYTLSARKQPKQAADEVRSMLSLEPENVSLRYLLAGLYQEMKDPAGAERELQRILQKKPEHAPSNNDLGYLWAERGVNLARAEELIRRALKAEPKSAAYMDSLGWVMYKQGRFEDAVKVLEDAVHAAPALDPVLWDHLGDAYWKANRHDEAVKAWQEAAKLLGAAGSAEAPVDVEHVKEKLEKSKAGGEPTVAPVAPKEEKPKSEAVRPDASKS